MSLLPELLTVTASLAIVALLSIIWIRVGLTWYPPAVLLNSFILLDGLAHAARLLLPTDFALPFNQLLSWCSSLTGAAFVLLLIYRTSKQMDAVNFFDLVRRHRQVTQDIATLAQIDREEVDFLHEIVRSRLKSRAADGPT